MNAGHWPRWPVIALAVDGHRWIPPDDLSVSCEGAGTSCSQPRRVNEALRRQALTVHAGPPTRRSTLTGGTDAPKK